MLKTSEEWTQPQVKDTSDSRFQLPDGTWGWVIRTIAVGLGGFQLYTAQFGGLVGLKQRSVHITLVLALAFLITGTRSLPNGRRKVRAMDLILGMTALVAGAYTVWIDSGLALRVGIVYRTDVVFGVTMLGLLIVATKRLLGWPLPIVTLAALLYAFYGRYFGPSIGHRGYSLERIIGHLYLTTEGIFGPALAASSTIIAIFILFGAFLRLSGGADFITNLAHGLFGHVRGGPAKVAIAASGLFGTMSGSAVANVAGTGSVTIPLMKRIGYRAPFAAAVEATASAGGQLMPPVMGAAAFMMAEFLGRPYLEIAAAALIPALLYYLAIFIQVDLEAVRTGLRGVRRSELPNPWTIFRQGWYVLFPIGLLVYLMAVVEWSPIKAGFWSIVAIVIVSMLKVETRMTFSKVLHSLEEGAYGLLEVAVACGVAGIVIGVFSLTGLGLKFSSFLVALSGGNLLVLLGLTMISSLILGMGMATLPTYLVLAVLVAPALVQMGVEPLAAHLFIFYFGIISAITPPVAVAAYAGAGIAQTDPMRTGFIASRLGLAGFILPYMFVMSPALIMKGSPLVIVGAVFSSILGIAALALGVGGGNVKWWERIVLVGASLMLIKPGITSDIIGLLVVGIVGIRLSIGARTARLPQVEESQSEISR